MGSILKRKRKDGVTTYLAQARRTGHPTQSETFTSRLEAQRWLTRIEAEMDAASSLRANASLTVPAEGASGLATSRSRNAP
jgi:hypothetical protein